eukprot:6209714-Pleurochrysis_carterae.AAC.3
MWRWLRAACPPRLAPVKAAVMVAGEPPVPVRVAGACSQLHGHGHENGSRKGQDGLSAFAFAAALSERKGLLRCQSANRTGVIYPSGCENKTGSSVQNGLVGSE